MKASRGFTLIEMVVVLAVIAILAAVLDLEHSERRQWVSEISKINRKVGGAH